jgi:hypothetical protein
MKSPATEVDGESIIVNGTWLRVASIQDEEVTQSKVLKDPEIFLHKLRTDKVKADLFTFSETLPEATGQLPYAFKWDNLAVIRITTFKDWWENRLPQETRKNVRRAGRRGVVVRAVTLDDALARGIKSIYDETPVRQGRRFWHYKKDLATVRKANETYRERSDFICAYHNDELVGFIRLVYVGQLATIMQILSKNAHVDKRPTNALIAKAVERCIEKGVRHLVYGRFIYGKNSKSPLTEFKRRNGFDQVMIRTYYIPLTLRGKVALKLRLHLGIKHILPERLTYFLLDLRSWFYSKRSMRSVCAQTAE